VTAPDRSDRWRPCASGSFDVEGGWHDRMACVEAKQGAVEVHPSDRELLHFLDLPFVGVYLIFML
jgi:hypothetical protein